MIDRSVGANGHNAILGDIAIRSNRYRLALRPIIMGPGLRAWHFGATPPEMQRRNDSDGGSRSWAGGATFPLPVDCSSARCEIARNRRPRPRCTGPGRRAVGGAVAGYASLDEALADPAIQLVVIATQPESQSHRGPVGPALTRPCHPPPAASRSPPDHCRCQRADGGLR